MNWSIDESASINTGGHAAGENLCDMVGDNFLHQFIKGPIHTSLETSLTYCYLTVQKLSKMLPLLLLDKCFQLITMLLNFQLNLNLNDASQCHVKCSTLIEVTSMNFAVPFCAYYLTLLCQRTVSNIDDCWLKWKKLFLGAVDKFIPTRTIKDKKCPPWIDGEVRHFIGKKYDALRKFRKDRSDIRKQNLRELSQEVKYLIRAKHREYLKKIEAQNYSGVTTRLSYTTMESQLRK